MRGEATLSWGAFWTITGVYLIMIVAAWCSRDAGLATIAAFLVGCQAFGLQ